MRRRAERHCIRINRCFTLTYYAVFPPDQRYIGSTSDLKSRLAKHNAGEVPHTSKFRPWKIETAVAFSSKEKAYAFEAYLQTHSGREFANRHFRYCIQKYFWIQYRKWRLANSLPL